MQVNNGEKIMIKFLLGFLAISMISLVQPFPSVLASTSYHSYLTGIVLGFTAHEIHVKTNTNMQLNVARKLINGSVDLRPGTQITFLYDPRLVKLIGSAFHFRRPQISE
jgi:hypothetical protein